MFCLLMYFSSSCLDLLCTVRHGYGDDYNSFDPPAVQQVVQQLQSTCATLLQTLSNIVVGMHSLSKHQQQVMPGQS